jgi:hypothetical protein
MWPSLITLKTSDMKQNLFAAAVIVFLTSFTVPLKKTDTKSANPYFEYSFAAAGSTGMPEINLDKSSAVYQVPKSKTAIPVLNIDGTKSVVRLKTGASEFLVRRVPGTTETPTDAIGLYKLNTDKKTRSLTLDGTGVISATKVNTNLVQIDTYTFRITITGGISAGGEYAFVEKNMAAANSTLTVWCFGID